MKAVGPLQHLLRFCLENQLIIFLLVLLCCGWGIMVAPFDWSLTGLPRDPVPVDAIPDYGANQQIVFTTWPGRSPQDVEDQVTYPLSSVLRGVPGVVSVRGKSMIGFSTISVIFNDKVEFYWSRSRLLEKLSSLPPGTLPTGVRPTLGPDATGLGQVYWYTLEGVDQQGQTTGGWGLEELRSLQDWQVRYALQSVEGVAEIASVGGFVKEYQVDLDPDAMATYGVTQEQVTRAVRMSNQDIGARTIAMNRVEYLIRGVGFITDTTDLEKAVITVRDNVPIRLSDVAQVTMGPALRRGILDKGGAEVVGGVVVVRFGANPLAVIKRVKQRIKDIAGSMPVKTLADGRVSQVKLVPFYDRTKLIHETLGTLRTALTDEIIATIIVVLVMMMHLRSSLLISGLLPMAVLLCFIAMKYMNVDANVVALSGIAIAIGTMVDMGIVISENIINHLRRSKPDENRLEVVFRASCEVGGAVLTAVLTTLVSFLPVFTMGGEEGKLFQPLAYTKTFALAASILVSLTVLPPLAHLLLRRQGKAKGKLFGVVSPGLRKWSMRLANLVAALAAAFLLARHWHPLGPDRVTANLLFTVGLLGGVLLSFYLFMYSYEFLLRLFLKWKLYFLSLPILLIICGVMIWRGLGREFMPRLDEGAFLLMPVTSPHASIGECYDILQKQDKAISAIPEVKDVVGKIGRVESAIDPAPLSMVETLITYHAEYLSGKDGQMLTFAFDEEKHKFSRDSQGELIADPKGRPYRQWRPHIRTPMDIWDEIAAAAKVPGTTNASMDQPINVRLTMLRTGMTSTMGLKVFGPDLPSIEKGALAIEKLLGRVSGINAATITADRVEGKPYMEILVDREAIARHGLHMSKIQEIIQTAVGGRRVTTTVEGRERYPVRIRYLRELRDSFAALERILVSTATGASIPLGQLAEISYRRGPQAIKSEDGFLVGYITFGKEKGKAEVDVIEAGQQVLDHAVAEGSLVLPPGVSYRFAGDYENQLRFQKKLQVVLPVALLIIIIILYLQFRSTVITMLVFSGVFVAWAGGFLMIWLYGQDWFLDFQVFNVNMRDLFQVTPLNLSVAVWVGFLALFGIATDDGVVMATYLKQSFARQKPSSIAEIRETVITAGKRRIRPCLMTSATTILALIPVLTSTGKGADVMIPMAIPSFGGMTVVMISVFVTPVLYSWIQETSWRWRNRKQK